MLPLPDIEAEAERVRKILDEQPANDCSDALYAAYYTLLYVLGYNVYPPVELWGTSSEDRRVRWRDQARNRVNQQSTGDGK